MSEGSTELSNKAIFRLSTPAAEAVLGVLQTVTGGDTRLGRIGTASAASPFDGAPMPAVIASVSYVGGAVGGNALLMTPLGACRLAAFMMGADPYAVEEAEVTELELSAVAEVANQVMATAAAAASDVLGEEIGITTPSAAVISTPAEAVALVSMAQDVTTAAFELLGEAAQLVQFVPTAFVRRMTLALEERSELVDLEDVPPPSPDGPRADMREVQLLMSVELGSARLPLRQAIALERDAVIEFDRLVEDPVDVLLGGMPFAKATLVVLNGAEFGLRIEQILPATAGDYVQLERGGV